MAHTPRFCPYCGAPQQPGAALCRACDRPLIDRPAPDSAAPTSARDFSPPGTQALRVLWGITALLWAGWAGALASGLDEISYPLLLLGLTLGLTALFFWRSIHNNRRRALEFLAGDRPLVRWVYTPAEWQQVRAYLYEQDRADPPPYGCLPVLFGLAGLLAGIMIGAEEGLAEAAGGALIGLAGGALAGGGAALLARFINTRHALGALAREQPAEVALGPSELFYENIYFDARRYRIEQLDLVCDEPPARLELAIWAPRTSLALNFPGLIIVPPRMLDAVQAALPHLRPGTAQLRNVDEEEL